MQRFDQGGFGSCDPLDASAEIGRKLLDQPRLDPCGPSIRCANLGRTLAVTGTQNALAADARQSSPSIAGEIAACRQQGQPDGAR
jgi:hypothetical protein